MILSLAGNPSIDRLFEVECLDLGHIHRPQHFIALPGGKGIHVAQVATALGARAIVTGPLAGHAGRWVAEELAAEGVEGRFVWTHGETRSSLSVADRETGRLTEFYEAGNPVTRDEWRELEAVVASLLPEARWLSLAGSLPPGTDTDGYSRLIRMAHEAGVATAVDSRSDGLSQTVDAHPDLVKINIHEAAELLERSVEGAKQCVAAAVEIREWIGGSGHAAVITMGEEGMVVVDPDGARWRGHLYVRGRYPVGSGDSVLAGILVGLDRGEPWPRAIALGLGAAAANAETPGAGHIDPARAIELAERAEVQRLED
ncbi:MAG: 1-phosphofructokinase family hexose kinase [Solirubrobacteraceae bacterium]